VTPGLACMVASRHLKGIPMLTLVLAALLSCTDKSGGTGTPAADGGVTDGGGTTDGGHDGGDTIDGGGLTDGGGVADDGGTTDTRPNLIVVLTDDQRTDLLASMPQTVSRIFEPGLVFDRAIVNTPLCCPMRSGFLAGGFLSRQTGVLRNSGYQGGMDDFDDSHNIGLHFQAAGYRTALVGKYLSTYDDGDAYIPPGWDLFAYPMVSGSWQSLDVVEGSSSATASTGKRFDVDQYITDYIHDQAEGFVRGAGDAPFLLVISEAAPHNTAQPDTKDDDAWAGSAWRGGAYNEADVSDKPSFIQSLPEIDADQAAIYDGYYQDALESLMSVDRGVDSLLDTLTELDLMDNTVIVFTSDNGHLFGEHRLWSKGVPYQESIGVPLAVLAPGGPAGVHDDRLVSATTDLPATLYDLAGIDAPTAGVSFAPLLRGESLEAQDHLLLEGYATAWSPDYAGLLTDTHKYVEYVNGESELYDLSADPYEEQNLAGEDSVAKVQASLAATLADNKPLILLPTSVHGDAGVAIDTQLQHWGGDGSVHHRAEGDLPAGLTLSDDGRITGVVDKPVTTGVDITITDESTSPYDGTRQEFTRRISFVIGSPGALVTAPPKAVRHGDHAEITVGARLPLTATWSFDPNVEFRPRTVPVVDGRIVIDGLGDRTAWVRIDGIPDSPMWVVLRP